LLSPGRSPAIANYAPDSLALLVSAYAWKLGCPMLIPDPTLPDVVPPRGIGLRFFDAKDAFPVLVDCETAWLLPALWLGVNTPWGVALVLSPPGRNAVCVF